jgi:hypothetical protein
VDNAAVLTIAMLISREITPARSFWSYLQIQCIVRSVQRGFGVRFICVSQSLDNGICVNSVAKKKKPGRDPHGMVNGNMRVYAWLRCMHIKRANANARSRLRSLTGLACAR